MIYNIPRSIETSEMPALQARQANTPSCNPSFSWIPLGACVITQANGPTIHSWGARVGVGGNQQLCVTPSTVVNSTLLMAPSVCDDAQLAAENMTYSQCASRRGGFIDPNTLSAASSAELGTLSSLNPGWPAIAGPDAFKSAVDAVMHLHGGPENDVSMLQGIIASGRNHTTSHLGLGDRSVVLDALLIEKHISSRSFGLNAGSTSVSAPRDGGIVFGDYDAGVAEGTFVQYPMTYSQILNDRVCPLQVTIKQLSLRQPGMPDNKLFGAEWPLQACIEPYDNLFRLPGTLVKNNLIPAVESILGSSPVVPPAVKGLWVNEPGLTFPNNKSSMVDASLVVTLDKNFTVEIPAYEFVRPLKGLAANGTSVVDNSFSEVQVYYDSNEPLNAAVLGKVFLSQVYLFVDYDNRVLKLANMNTESRSSVPLAGGSGTAGCGEEQSGVHGATIGVIVIGAVVFVLLLLLIGAWQCRQWRNGKRPTNAEAGDDRVQRDDIVGQHLPEVDHRELNPVVTNNQRCSVSPDLIDLNPEQVISASPEPMRGTVTQEVSGKAEPKELADTTVSSRSKEELGTVLARGLLLGDSPWGSVSTVGGGGSGHARRHMSSGTGISPLEPRVSNP
ncbi:uncharacterized protein E0L32_000210 [Thyridium curvatum]|uniref:Peptidase A1 domain-containing protein n=1 Tax=Thyridium curvatum TaxID=1093900 RepID=A0A507B9M7_9PEZI|nr:uncharacterized protein E0L32_000210 [Thyridium curvatum]TPX15876.1 hypothetical protein E0L32_000210 [Thyridium curvatum]